MRAHALKALRLSGSEDVLTRFPAFDFYNLQQVKKLCLCTASGGDDSYDLELAATYVEGEEEVLVGFVFSGVRMVRVPELSPSFYLAEFEIEDLAGDKLEGIHYRARCYGTPRFEVMCRDIAIRLVAEGT